MCNFGGFQESKNNSTGSIARRMGLILLVFMLLVPSASARDYTLEEVTANITVDSQGITHVEESISYSFDGTYHEVFRQVYPPVEGSIENIQGYCEEYECGFEVVPIAGGYELIGKLPQPTPDKITFVISYDYYRGVKVYNDISELHFKLWGDEWEKPLNGLTAAITLPVENGNNVEYWLHPDDYTKNSFITGNVITVNVDHIPSYSWYEIRAVFPRLQSADPRFVSIQDEDAMEKILAIEKEYEEKQKTINYLYRLSILFFCLVIIFPLLIYFRYGREPKIDYQVLYEREPPTNSKPAVVNAIMKSEIGVPTIDGFTATVMDLVNRGYLSLHDIKSEGKRLGLFKYESEDLIIKIKKDELSELDDIEIVVFNLLKSHSRDKKILWSELKKELGKDTSFYNFINNWNMKVKNRIKIDKIFISKGNSTMQLFGIFVILIIILAYFLIDKIYSQNEFPTVLSLLYLFIAIGIFSLMMIIFTFISEKSFGRWTPEGKLFHKQWNNFSKYLTDFSALNEHPPESIKIWDFYMVYAVALGVADKALENMKLIVPSEQLEHSNFYPVHHGIVFGSIFQSAYQASAPKGSSGSGSGGVGGVGGGFGGGGGGAR